MDSMLSSEVPGTETDLKKILGAVGMTGLGDSYAAVSYPPTDGLRHKGALFCV